MLSKYLLKGRNKRLKCNWPVVRGFLSLFGAVFVHVNSDFRFLPSGGAISVLASWSAALSAGVPWGPWPSPVGLRWWWPSLLPAAPAVPLAVELKQEATLFQSYLGRFIQSTLKRQNNCLVMLPRFGAVPEVGSFVCPGPGTLGTIHSSLCEVCKWLHGPSWVPDSGSGC